MEEAVLWQCTADKVTKYASGPVHTRPEKFKHATITGHFGFVFEKNSDREVTKKFSVRTSLRSLAV